MLAQLQALSSSQLTLLLGGVGLFAGVSIYAIYDAFNRDFGSSNAKLGWIQLAVLVPFSVVWRI